MTSRGSWTLATLAITALTLMPSVVAAQQPRTAVAFGAGVASGASDTGIGLGGTVLFDLNERASIEGHGTYLDRGAGAEAFNAGGSLLVNLLPSSSAVVPYAAIGGSVHHASYDLAHGRFLGPAGTQFDAGSRVCASPGTGFGFGPGPGWGSGAATCPAGVSGFWGVGELPAFYARRLGSLTFPRGGTWESRSFTDPALNVGGGVRFNVTDRFMLRPDVRALVVFADGETHTLGFFAVNLGFRF